MYSIASARTVATGWPAAEPPGAAGRAGELQDYGRPGPLVVQVADDLLDRRPVLRADHKRLAGGLADVVAVHPQVSQVNHVVQVGE